MSLVTVTLICIFSWAVLGFIVSRILRRNDIADGMWGLGFVAIAWVQFSQFENYNLRAVLVLLFVSFWGARLSYYLWKRLLGKSEDARYLEWRKQWGNAEPQKAFFKVFLLQAIIMAFVSLPVSWVLRHQPAGITPWDFLATCLLILGLLFEVISDAQMACYKKNKSTEILNSGLWQYCRHPNYFGEILIWWGFFFFSFTLDNGWVTIASPLLISFLLLKVSGIPMLEKLLRQKGESFKKYVAKTPSILPFHLKIIIPFFLLATNLVILDALWLGLFMKNFYVAQTAHVARMGAGEWAPLLWPAVGVYFFIALGLYFFAISKVSRLGDVFFRGAIFGLCSYAIYEFTNLSLVNNWPIDMALVDIIWGTVLCGSASLFTKMMINFGVNDLNKKEGLILLAHGSKDPRWREPFEDILEKCRQLLPNKKVFLCYLEFCEPKLKDVISNLMLKNPQLSRIKIVPIFLSTGKHSREDIPALVAEIESQYTNLTIQMDDVIGENPLVSNAILMAVAAND